VDAPISTRRTALVTGANRGIGFAIATGLAAAGHDVAVCARHLADADSAAERIGHGAFGVALDVTDPPGVALAVDQVIAHTGRLDVVVNNAGGHYDDGVAAAEMTDDDLIDALDINTVGPWRVIRAALPHLRAAGWGRIVNVSSRSGTFSATWATAPGYAVSKAALNMLTLQLASDLNDTGILVNACCPGWVRTRMGGEDAERSVEEGADTPIWLATLPDDGPSGFLFGDRVVIDW
jgi:NAD(P)-dependent dehydrogenase (short-subunit alcohol dehydrogenase family)